MNTLATPNSKITGGVLPPIPTKTRLYTRRPRLSLAAITERNLVFNSMMTDAENQPDSFATPIRTQREPIIPDAPRKIYMDTSETHTQNFDSVDSVAKKLNF